jgi:hypothetical protein
MISLARDTDGPNPVCDNPSIPPADHPNRGYVGLILRTRPADSTVRSPVRVFLKKRKVQVALNGGLGLVLLAVSFFSVKHFMGGGWPLHHADPVLVVAAAILFLIAYAFKAWGWQRLFREEERPTAGAPAFAGGAACVGGVAMPGRVDDAIRIACVKRYPGTSAGLGTIGLSLIIVGMLDNAALAPLAGIAISDARSWTVRAGFLVVSVAGVLAAVVVSMLPKFAGMRRVMRFAWAAGSASTRRIAASRSLRCFSSPSRGRSAARRSSSC